MGRGSNGKRQVYYTGRDRGVGKTTHLAFIADYLKAHQYPVLITREPGGTKTGEAIREILLHGKEMRIDAMTELLLMFAARTRHLQEVVAPALAAGQMVLCDRFTDASYAYQGGGRGIAQADIHILEKLVQQDLKPDLTLLFDASVQTGLSRAKKRSEADRFESETIAFFERVRQTYLERSRNEPDRIKIIDAEQTLPAVEQEIIRLMESFL